MERQWLKYILKDASELSDFANDANLEIDFHSHVIVGTTSSKNI